MIAIYVCKLLELNRNITPMYYQKSTGENVIATNGNGFNFYNCYANCEIRENYIPWKFQGIRYSIHWYDGIQPLGTLPNGVAKYWVGGLVVSMLANAQVGWTSSNPSLRHCCCSKLYSCTHLARASYKLHEIGSLFVSDCFALENSTFITGAALISVGRGLCQDCCICVQVRSAGTDCSFIIT